MKEINWSKISSIAEIISSVAILITLFYLAIQTKQNTDAILASSRDTQITNDVQILNTVSTHPEIRLSMVKPEISELEMIQLTSWLISLLRTREHQWFQYKNGALDEDVWRSYLSGLAGNLSTERTRFIWNSLYESRSFDEEFSELVNNILADTQVSNNIGATESDFQNR